MSITIESFEFRTRPMSTRFPFRYGIAAMTELPHVFLYLRAVIDGKPCGGLASEGLPPKWFTKDTETRFEEDLPQMVQVLERRPGLPARLRRNPCLPSGRSSTGSRMNGHAGKKSRLCWHIWAPHSLSGP